MQTLSKKKIFPSFNWLQKRSTGFLFKRVNNSSIFITYTNVGARVNLEEVYCILQGNLRSYPFGRFFFRSEVCEKTGTSVIEIFIETTKKFDLKTDKFFKLSLFDWEKVSVTVLSSSLLDLKPFFLRILVSDLDKVLYETKTSYLLDLSSFEQFCERNPKLRKQDNIVVVPLLVA